MMLKYLKYLFVITIAAVFSLPVFSVEKEKNPADGNCRGFVIIKGSSNINQFKFVNYEPKVQNASGSISEENLIRIPVHSFETSNNRMLNDFYEMVKANKHPFIDISIEPRRKADFDEGSGLTNFITKVTIAGNSNTYTVPSHVSGCEHQGYLLSGNLQVKLTDFDIDPPVKLLGAVKVNNDVFINFAFPIQHEDQLTQQVND